MLYEAYVGLGSNLGDRRATLLGAFEALRRDAVDVAVSSLYESLPVGFTRQPPFLNAVCRLWTRLDPFQLLERARRTEAAAGPRRPFPNAPRALDVDLLTHGRAALSLPGLVLPHPRMADRAFVLVPLAELAPTFVHPTLRLPVGALVARLPRPLGLARRAAESTPARPQSREDGGSRLGIASSMG